MAGGWPTFSVIWIGEVVSLLGSELTSFALDVWVYQQSNSATLFAIMIFFTLTPGIILAPFAGALVDRWDRRKVLILTDAGAALISLAVFFLFRFGVAQVWHLYVAVGVSSVLEAFQMPALQASITLLVPQKDLARANGMYDAGTGIIKVGAPALAGILLPLINLSGIILIDIATFGVAVLALLVVSIPKPQESKEAKEAQGNLLKEAWHGWQYISRYPGFIGLAIFFAINNFLQGLVLSIFMPMLLSFASAEVAGRVVSIALSGLLIGGIAMIVWGGPKRRMHGVVLGSFVVGIAMIAGGLRADATLITIAGFVYWLMDPLIYGSAHAIWQSRVPADIQGRVFSINRVITWSTLPVAFLLAGVLADRIFDPLLSRGGPLAGSLIGQMFGTGPGRGIGLMFSLAGVVSVIVAVASHFYPRLRLLEDEIPVSSSGEESAEA